MKRIIFILILIAPFASSAQQQVIPAILNSNGMSTGPVDTTSLSNRINNKVDKGDTAAMLNNYLRVGEGGGASTPTLIGAQRSMVLNDSGKYITSTVICQTDNGMKYNFFNLAPSHTSTGTMYVQKSKDGTNWTAARPVIINGDTISNCGLIAAGNNGNRILLSYQTSNTYLSINYTYCEDEAVTWANSTSVGLSGSQTEIANYGRITQIVGDTLYAPFYANFSVDTSQVGFHKSYDNGATWSMGAIIKKGRIGQVFPNGPLLTETWILKIKQGTTVANTSLMALIRPEPPYIGYTYQMWTDAGGVTTADWHDVAVEQGKWFSEYNASSGPNQFPVSASIVHDSIIYVYIGYRGNHVLGLNSDLRVIKGPLAAYKNPDLFSKPYRIYSATSFKAAHNDFGYAYDFVENGQPYVGIYDISAKHKSGASLQTTKTRGVVIPVEGNNYFDAYNSSNQPITTDTETTVSTPTIRLDSERSYSDDSSKIYFQYDGWYTISARITFDGSASGTYRRATLWMVDHGDEYGTAPTSMGGKYMITQKSIAPSTNAEFNRIELFGQIYAFAGMELRLTVQHDVGSSLNLLNTVQNNRATIYFKKSN